MACDATHAASMDDKASQEVLMAMGRTSTWGHPDEFGEFAGMSYYASGDYAKAMESFKLGARYADKLSQLSIGLMYLHGEGVVGHEQEPDHGHRLAQHHSIRRLWRGNVEDHGRMDRDRRCPLLH